MKQFTGLNYLEFADKFSTDKDCYDYLFSMKEEIGYKCLKCGNNEYRKGRNRYYRRCTKCHYDESVTAGTLFHKLKFPIRKAFHILFRISTKKKGMSTIELANEFDLRQKTCWLFKSKIQDAMRSSGKHPLRGTVHVDEFLIGGPEEGRPGRSQGAKKKVIIAVEVPRKGQTGRAYARVIKDFSSESFRPIFEKRIDAKANVETDGFSSYSPFKKNFKLKQFYSEMGKTFPELHIQIMNFKKWLIGIHHHCAEHYLQKYLDEYFYRFNRRNHMNSIFHKLLKRFVKQKPSYLSRSCQIGA